MLKSLQTVEKVNYDTLCRPIHRNVLPSLRFVFVFLV